MEKLGHKYEFGPNLIDDYHCSESNKDTNKNMNSGLLNDYHCSGQILVFTNPIS